MRWRTITSEAKEQMVLTAMSHTLAGFRADVVAALATAEGPEARLRAIVAQSFAPGHFERATISAWLTFYMLAHSNPAARRLLALYRRRLLSNLRHDLRPVGTEPVSDTLATRGSATRAATPAVIEAALASAVTARAEWAGRTGAERGRVLRRAADLIRARNRALSRLETLDTGKPLQETLVANASRGADALEYFGGMAGTLTGQHVPLGPDWGYTIREPLGVCVGIGAWNYPTQIACWKAAPALACGNAMVFKLSKVTPLCALKIAEILTEAGAPPGLSNVVQGAGAVGAALVADPRVAKVSLTGSVPTGRKVYAAAAEGMTHVTMELGGKSPLIVFDDADLDDAVDGAIPGNFYSTGQVCSNGTRVFVQWGIREAFLARLVARLRGVRMGDPLDEATNFGPMASAAQQGFVTGYIAAGIAEGARLVAGGGVPDRSGFWVEPTVFAGVADAMTIARDESFGPVMCVLDFDDEDEVIAHPTPPNTAWRRASSPATSRGRTG